jgi:hypothetical protein
METLTTLFWVTRFPFTRKQSMPLYQWTNQGKKMPRDVTQIL